MGMFSTGGGQLVDALCRKDLNGRLVFLPHGRRRAGYYLDSTADYQKVKALVPMYFVARALFQVLGSTASLIITLGAASGRSGPLAGKLEFALIIYILSAFAFQWLPMLLLWRFYRALLAEICSSLQEIKPEAVGDLQAIPNPMRRRAMMLAFAGLLIMGGVLLFLVSRPDCVGTGSTAVQTQR